MPSLDITVPLTDWRHIAKGIRPEKTGHDAMREDERVEWQRQLKEHLQSKHRTRQRTS